MSEPLPTLEIPLIPADMLSLLHLIEPDWDLVPFTQNGNLVTFQVFIDGNETAHTVVLRHDGTWTARTHITLKATMPNLTKTQLEHAKTRIEQAKAAYYTRMIAPFGKRPKVLEYTDTEMISMIRKGHATLKDTANIARYGSLYDFFDYPRTPLMQQTRDELDAWKVHHNAITETADKLEQKLLDELIMSPDGAATLLNISTAFA